MLRTQQKCMLSALCIFRIGASVIERFPSFPVSRQKSRIIDTSIMMIHECFKFKRLRQNSQFFRAIPDNVMNEELGKTPVCCSACVVRCCRTKNRLIIGELIRFLNIFAEAGSGEKWDRNRDAVDTDRCSKHTQSARGNFCIFYVLIEAMFGIGIRHWFGINPFCGSGQS